MKLVAKPAPGQPIIADGRAAPELQIWFDEIQNTVNTQLLGPTVKLTVYAKASLPTAVAGGLIYVSDDAGGAVVAFADGTDWRRVTDRAVIA